MAEWRECEFAPGCIVGGERWCELKNRYADRDDDCAACPVPALPAKAALCDELADVVRNYRKHIESMIEALDAAKSAFEALEKGDGSECASASDMVDDVLAGAFDEAGRLDEFLSEYDALEVSR